MIPGPREPLIKAFSELSISVAGLVRTRDTLEAAGLVDYSVVADELAKAGSSLLKQINRELQL